MPVSAGKAEKKVCSDESEPAEPAMPTIVVPGSGVASGCTGLRPRGLLTGVDGRFELSLTLAGRARDVFFSAMSFAWSGAAMEACTHLLCSLMYNDNTTRGGAEQWVRSRILAGLGKSCFYRVFRKSATSPSAGCALIWRAVPTCRSFPLTMMPIRCDNRA